MSCTPRNCSFPHEEICVHSVLLTARSCVSVCLHVQVSVNASMSKSGERRCVRWAERVSLYFLSSTVITCWQLIPLRSALMDRALLLTISVQILVHSDKQIACGHLPLFAFAICCDRQLGTLLCLIAIALHSYYSMTEKATWPWRTLKMKIHSLHSHISL